MAKLRYTHAYPYARRMSWRTNLLDATAAKDKGTPPQTRARIPLTYHAMHAAMVGVSNHISAWRPRPYGRHRLVGALLGRTNTTRSVPALRPVNDAGLVLRYAYHRSWSHSQPRLDHRDGQLGLFRCTGDGDFALVSARQAIRLDLDHSTRHLPQLLYPRPPATNQSTDELHRDELLNTVGSLGGRARHRRHRGGGAVATGDGGGIHAVARISSLTIPLPLSVWLRLRWCEPLPVSLLRDIRLLRGVRLRGVPVWLGEANRCCNRLPTSRRNVAGLSLGPRRRVLRTIRAPVC
mmetsp:Transcript_22468/g.72651  ORF Transcript_22468/g.72651 Transcript_22468/m.72651 type:complete len:293 (+) Transcript_22468:165-1043(+)